MTDDIIEAAARVVEDFWNNTAPSVKAAPSTRDVMEAVVAAVTPLIRAAALEEAATVVEKRQRLTDIPREIVAIREAAADLRALKEQP